MEKKQETRPQNIQVGLDSAHARYQQFEGADQLLEQVLAFSRAVMQYRISQDYGDYLAKQTPNPAAELRKALFATSRTSLAEILDHLVAEKEAVHQAALRGDPSPHTPWTFDVYTVARTLGHTTCEQLIWEFHSFAERDRAGYKGFSSLLEKQDWMGLATIVLRDLKALETIYPKGMPSQRLHMQHAIESVRDRYYDKCYYNSKGAAVVVARVSEWPGLQ